ncbi:uncharacterized protein METZ01_LOCUS49097 [marine metagenome]|uniref:Uncharacterized protein n=1 Tax=marine metagenome TaxID=408172 RepID=A0A381S508_9ZZZZ
MLVHLMEWMHSWQLFKCLLVFLLEQLLLANQEPLMPRYMPYQLWL